MKISVIIPVYNSERYLYACIESVLNQTFHDFELILVDDGSTDASGSICDEFAQKDNRVIVLHKSNEGVSAARNDGLALARGEYITFVDSDDTIENDMFENMYNSAKDSDIVVCGLNLVFEDHIESHTIEAIETLDIKGFVTNYLVSELKNLTLAGPVNKLFKTKVIRENGVEFNLEITVLEDGLFVIDFLRHAKKICAVQRCFYQYIQHSGSAIRKFHKNNLRAMSLFYDGLQKLLSVHSINTHEIQEYIDEFFYARFMDSIRQVCVFPKIKKATKIAIIKEHLKSDLHKNIFSVKRSMAFHKKMKYWLLRFCGAKIISGFSCRLFLKLFA